MSSREVVVKNDDEMQVEQLVQTLVDGWNSEDAAMCARPFARDADFTAITGLRAKGKDVIAKGYAEILATLYRGSRNSAKIESIRFLRPDVAVVDVTFRFIGELRPFNLERSSCGLVCTKDEGVWTIAVFRNMVPFARPVAGPLERELLAATQ